MRGENDENEGAGAASDPARNPAPAEVWQCGSSAVDGGHVYFIAATEHVALEWLEAKRAQCATVARRANRRPDKLMEWPVPDAIERDSSGRAAYFVTLGDTFYARRVTVHTAVPEEAR